MRAWVPGVRQVAMEASKVIHFETLRDNVGRFDLSDKTFLIPQMNRIGGHLLAGTFRGFGVRAEVMDTCRGQELGMAYTSGKECYPCQITTGDILHHLRSEQEKLGDGFNPRDYVYFMPEADGPCRFGMYNKFQRMVLDSFPDFREVKICSLTTKDGYSLDGIIDPGRVSALRKASYFSVVVGDVLDRLLWRIRPYEREPGAADDFIERSMGVMERCFETYGVVLGFDSILEALDAVAAEGRALIDPGVPRKPLIGIVGEIYLRTHTHANQDIIRVLEKYGAEVVNASIAEWVNYATFERLREAGTGFRLNLKQLRLDRMRSDLSTLLTFAGDLLYQEFRQKQVYRRVKRLVDVADDHRVGELEEVLEQEGLFSFDVGTEACLSIPGIIEYARSGYNGVANVYPFTCMPSTITSAITRPLMSTRRIPYLDTPYDSSVQPGREAAIRTFMYQARQHHERYGRNPRS